jgi:glycerol uptake facilitator-like aquaporin
VTRIAALPAESALPVAVHGQGLVRRAVADGTATAFLLAVIVGSGVMGERLSNGNIGFTLLVNSLVSGAGLVALILAFGRSSGAHMNPVVTLAQASWGTIPWRAVPLYVVAQAVGAVAGVIAAHIMFGLPVLSIAHHARAGLPQIFAEGIATFGLVVVIRGASALGIPAVAAAVGSYIAAGYWFTSSTSFANPAVTVARSLTDSFVGIRPIDVPGFLLGQAVGGGAALLFCRWLAGGRSN